MPATMLDRIEVSWLAYCLDLLTDFCTAGRCTAGV
jgi:hypothetical protein